MKAFLVLLLLSLYTIGIGQNKSNTRRQVKKITATRPKQPAITSAPAEPRQTITEKRLNPTRYNTNTGSQATADKGEFVSGIHAADNAKKHYDSVPPPNPNSINNNQRAVATGTETPASGNGVVLENDTIANANTVHQSGIATTSGAVDKSGQAQFGQANWGSSRSTIGEGQWTVPPPVSSSFTKEYPSASNITWSRSNTDSSLYLARYKTGAEWIISSYNSTGNRLDRRTEISLQQMPQTVDTYLHKQAPQFQATYINRLQVQGKPEVYEIVTQSGRTIYLNNDGVEVAY